MTAVPLVSILTPTYNHRLYIRQCIESVLAQTDERWEQIVLDDDSSRSSRATTSGRPTSWSARSQPSPTRTS
ncbi:MAG: glycosyltransferase [Chloroflexi bacterium]|nr:glycosyltransferase [Chloroflexota bacterium]